MVRRAVLFCLVCMLGSAPAGAQWGPGGGGMGGRRSGPGMGDPSQFEEARTKMEALRALPIEAMWAVLSFDLELTPAQAGLLRELFGTVWKKRAAILEESGGGKRDWKAIRDEFKDMKKDLEEKVKAALGQDLWKAYSKQVKSYEKQVPRLPTGGSGPPGFAPPGGE